LIAAVQNQVSLQHQLLAAQATLARQDKLLASAWTTPQQVVGMTLASLTAVAQAPMIISDAQLEGYVYIGSNWGQAIWGHADIVQASLTDPAGNARAGSDDAPPL
jgi:hypothetical protein